MSRQQQVKPNQAEHERLGRSLEQQGPAVDEAVPVVEVSARRGAALLPPPPNQTAAVLRQARVTRLQRQVGNGSVSRLLGLASRQTPGVLQRAPALEDLVAEAQGQVGDAEVEQEQAPPVEAEPITLPEAAPAEGGDAGGGGGGGAAPEAAAAPAAAAPVGAPAETLDPSAVPAEQAQGTGAPQPTAGTAATPEAQGTGTPQPAAGTAATPEAQGTGAPQPAPGTAATPEAQGTGAPQPAAGTAATPEAQGATEESAAAEETEEEDEDRPDRRTPIQRLIAPKSPAEDPAFQAVAGQIKGVAAQQKAHEPPQKKADQAAAAAQMPPQERQGLAQSQQAAEVNASAAAQASRAAGGEAPGFNKVAFVASVKAKIDELTPKDPQQMENIEGSGVFSGAKQAVDAQVQSGKEAAGGNVDEKIDEAPNTAAVPERQPTPLAPNQPGAAPAVAAAGAAPKPRGPEEVEAPLQAGSAQLESQMATANITEEQLRDSNEPQFQAALAAKSEAQEHAATAPQVYRSGEQATVAGSQADATAQAQAGVTGMHSGRSRVFGQMDQVQARARSGDEAKRAEIGRQIDGIYSATKSDVEGILAALDTKVDQEFSRGADAAKASAVDYIKRETQAYKDRRYNRDAAWYDVGSHVSGAVTHLGDAITGMPDEYYEYFRQGRDRYCREMEAVIGRVADIVADHLARAKQRIEQGRQQINDFVASQPAALRQVAQEAAGDALNKFTDLEQTVDAKQNEVIDNLAQQYVERLQSLDSELEQMKEADKGLVAKAADAIGGVINTIRELGQLLAGALQRAASAIPRILQNPVEFLGNLLQGVKQGFLAFAGNIGTHLQQGLIGWLTGALGSAGITLPSRLDLPGIFNLVLQLLGLTWASIRARIVQRLGPMGEQIMGALEQAWEVVQIIRSEGLGGLWRFVQQMVGDLQEMVIGQIKEMVITQVIKAGVDWLIGILGGPAGAFVKAAQAIIRIVTWFLSNGARVMALVNSVLDSVVSIAAGNISGAAQYIEQSLARALPVVISFLANLLGLGGIARKVQEIIQKVQAPIGKAIDWVVKKALALGKRIMGALGGRGRAGASGTTEDKGRRWSEGLKAIRGLPEQTPKEIKGSLKSIKKTYGFDVLKPVASGNHWQVSAIMRNEEKLEVKREGGEAPVIPDNLRSARGQANAAIESVSKMLERKDVQEKLGERASGFVSKLADISTSFKSNEALLLEPDVEAVVNDLLAGFRENEEASKALKRDVTAAIRSETKEEADIITVGGRKFRPANERSKFGQPIYKEEGREFYISPDVGSGDGGGAHIGGTWKGATSPARLRSKATRSGTYDANLNRIGD